MPSSDPRVLFAHRMTTRAVIGAAEFSSANNSFHDNDSSIAFRNGDGAFATATTASFLASSCPKTTEPSSPVINSTQHVRIMKLTPLTLFDLRQTFLGTAIAPMRQQRPD